MDQPFAQAPDTCLALNLHSFLSRNEAEISKNGLKIHARQHSSNGTELIEAIEAEDMVALTHLLHLSKNGLMHARLQHLPDGTVLIEPIEALSHEEAQDLVK